MKYFALRIQSSFLFIFAVLGALFSIAVVAQTAPSTPAPALPTPTTSAGAANKSQSATASQQSGTTIPAPVLKVTTRLVLADAVVTDHAGHAVTDLKPEDFEITDNGKPQKVRFFHLQQTNEQASNGSAPPVPQWKLQPGVYTNIPDPGTVTGPPTVLLVDGLNTPGADQSRMRQQLLKYLQKLGPRRSIAIYLLGRDLSVLQDFTDDPQLLQAALSKLGPFGSVTLQPEAGPDDLFIRDFGSVTGAQLPALVLQHLREFETEQLSRETDDRVGITVAALSRLAQILAGYPGRKNLIWLSGAFPMSIVPDQNNRMAADAQRSYAKQIDFAANLLTDAQVAVYTVDVRGLDNNSLSAETNGADASGQVRRNGAFQEELSRQEGVDTDIHASEKELAEQTGGRAFYNSNDLNQAVKDALADGSTYYTLGYYPENIRWDGAFHKIVIKVTRKGLGVRSRKGYFAYDLALTEKINEETARMEFIGALTPGTPAMTTLPFAAIVAPPAKPGDPVTVEYSVEPHSIAFEDQKNAKLDFVIRAFDAHGKSAGNQSQSFTFDLTPEKLEYVKTHGLRIKQTITLPSGRFLLKVGVRDVKSNAIGTLSATVQVPVG